MKSNPCSNCTHKKDLGNPLISCTNDHIKESWVEEKLAGVRILGEKKKEIANELSSDYPSCFLARNFYCLGMYQN